MQDTGCRWRVNRQICSNRNYESEVIMVLWYERPRRARCIRKTSTSFSLRRLKLIPFCAVQVTRESNVVSVFFFFFFSSRTVTK
ncbi:hypothetical protein K445DRAFT_148241 [Daldinia sp. EC12]|nr:hypothetical protein K445DRAFT_148241 [Daldinia sp. EC12]